MTSFALRIYAFLIIIVSCVFDDNFNHGRCLRTDHEPMEVGSTWTNEGGCSCTCQSINNYTFSLCSDCLSGKIVEPLNETNKCVSSGFEYNLNERWLSTEVECSMCQCKRSGVISCSSEKHCSNSCQEGQIPVFGPCCDIQSCIGKASIIQETKDCSINREKILHGKSIVRRYHCTDKFCSCNNGAVQCFEYCKLSKNNTYYYWDRFCCPREIGNKKCQTPSHRMLNPGESFLFISKRKSCRCLDGEIYCSIVNSTASISSKSIDVYKKTYDATTPFFTISTKTHLKAADHIMKELIVILSLFTFVITILILIVIIIKWRIERWNKYRGTKKRLLLNQEDF